MAEALASATNEAWRPQTGAVQLGRGETRHDQGLEGKRLGEPGKMGGFDEWDIYEKKIDFPSDSEIEKWIQLWFDSAHLKENNDFTPCGFDESTLGLNQQKVRNKQVKLESVQCTCTKWSYNNLKFEPQPYLKSKHGDQLKSCELGIEIILDTLR